ncbi:DUF1643 domain-containing protein [uncultured Maribacter sp.]|uniref:DUF1643 domain-containing protein n=1 Tax=uncultured Maribacter sp. TaxID=431308 RepID=UPI0030D90503|tara:strand:+ start:10056 stop:11201 length:1146 start_codon:yes stop_codon:yes gene_type:complete
MKVLINRVKGIIDLCWDSFSAKVGCGLIVINKEASMQLQFAYLLKNSLDLVVYNEDESVELELEMGIRVGEKTRVCDIIIHIEKGTDKIELPIELKCYRNISSSSGKLRGAQDLFKFGVYEDLELLESYVGDNRISGVQLTMTDARNFVYPRNKTGKSWDYDISDGHSITNGIELNTPIGGKEVSIILKGSYNFAWINKGAFYFLKIQSNEQKWVYAPNEDNTARYTLGKVGNRNLICVGINPSTATPEKLDTTLRKVSNIAEQKGYDGWLMLNVYPQRDTYPENLGTVSDAYLIKENNKAIKEVLSNYDFADIWAAWGTTIEHRAYLKDCLIELSKNFNFSYRWLHYDELTKYGHPRHPLYVSYDKEFSEFNITSYLESL